MCLSNQKNRTAYGALNSPRTPTWPDWTSTKIPLYKGLLRAKLPFWNCQGTKNPLPPKAPFPILSVNGTDVRIIWIKNQDSGMIIALPMTPDNMEEWNMYFPSIHQFFDHSAGDPLPYDLSPLELWDSLLKRGYLQISENFICTGTLNDETKNYTDVFSNAWNTIRTSPRKDWVTWLTGIFRSAVWMFEPSTDSFAQELDWLSACWPSTSNQPRQRILLPGLLKSGVRDWTFLTHRQRTPTVSCLVPGCTAEVTSEDKDRCEYHDEAYALASKLQGISLKRYFSIGGVCVYPAEESLEPEGTDFRIREPRCRHEEEMYLGIILGAYEKLAQGHPIPLLAGVLISRLSPPTPFKSWLELYRRYLSSANFLKFDVSPVKFLRSCLKAISEQEENGTQVLTPCSILDPNPDIEACVAFTLLFLDPMERNPVMEGKTEVKFLNWSSKGRLADILPKNLPTPLYNVLASNVEGVDTLEAVAESWAKSLSSLPLEGGSSFRYTMKKIAALVETLFDHKLGLTLVIPNERQCTWARNELSDLINQKGTFLTFVSPVIGKSEATLLRLSTTPPGLDEDLLPFPDFTPHLSPITFWKIWGLKGERTPYLVPAASNPCQNAQMIRFTNPFPDPKHNYFQSPFKTSIGKSFATKNTSQEFSMKEEDNVLDTSVRLKLLCWAIDNCVKIGEGTSRKVFMEKDSDQKDIVSQLLVHPTVPIDQSLTPSVIWSPWNDSVKAADPTLFTRTASLITFLGGAWRIRSFPDNLIHCESCRFGVIIPEGNPGYIKACAPEDNTLQLSDNSAPFTRAKIRMPPTFEEKKKLGTFGSEDYRMNLNQKEGESDQGHADRIQVYSYKRNPL